MYEGKTLANSIVKFPTFLSPGFKVCSGNTTVVVYPLIQIYDSCLCVACDCTVSRVDFVWRTLIYVERSHRAGLSPED